MRHELISAHNPGPFTGAGNNTYLIVGREPTLIDAGIGDPRHLERVAAVLRNRTDHNRGTPSLARLLVTHAHPDHASGAPAIAARWPGAISAKMPWPERDGDYPASWHALADGDLVPAGDTVLRVVHTPGHSPDHVCFLDKSSGTLFSGDLVVTGSTVMIPASAGGHLVSYLESLRRVLAIAPQRLLPAHGPAIADPERIIQQYLDHRRFREDQIAAVLHAGRHTVDQIVSCVYENLEPALVRGARENVLAHLEKLTSERRVARDGDVWYPCPAGVD